MRCFILNISIRTAAPADVSDIMHIMDSAHRAMADPSAYITDDSAYVSAHIRKNGFTLMAEVDGSPAGFFLVCVPGALETKSDSDVPPFSRRYVFVGREVRL